MTAVKCASCGRLIALSEAIEVTATRSGLVRWVHRAGFDNGYCFRNGVGPRSIDIIQLADPEERERRGAPRHMNRRQLLAMREP
jgi:hypothetical protein